MAAQVRHQQPKQDRHGTKKPDKTMTYNPKIHHRRSIRLQGYDYSQAGMYFLTICTNERACLFGEIVDGVMCLNDAGRMVLTVWNDMPRNYFGIAVDKFVVMPNHIHGIVTITTSSGVGATPRGRPGASPTTETGQAQGPAPTRTLSLPEIVRRFKTMATKQYTDGVHQNSWPSFNQKLWQRNYWEHIIRNESELTHLREYIHNNPMQWNLDKLHPSAPP
ncbi:MAG: transposase [Burkholderiaceae bacterium]|nr:transposase [Burkholderiaceae bacterium]